MVECISIHALRKESDMMSLMLAPFLVISIHALRKESDVIALLIAPFILYFNPRSP